MANKSIKTRVLELGIVAVDGTTYLGSFSKEGEVGTMTNAVPAVEGDLEETIKNWIKSDNLDELVEFTVEGNTTSVLTRKYTASDKLLINSVCSAAEFNMSRAVANLENSSI